MPYIEKYKRALARYDPNSDSPGELNYALTDMVLWWLDGRDDYAAMNAAVGALECAKLELYRRMVAPYEDAKRAENGDVYPLEVAPGKFRYSEPLDGRPKKYPTLPPDEHYPGCICVLCVA